MCSFPVVTRLGLGSQGTVFQFTAKTKHIFVYQNIQTGTAAHTASDLVTIWALLQE
jgi:hypothetical protein